MVPPSVLLFGGRPILHEKFLSTFFTTMSFEASLQLHEFS